MVLGCTSPSEPLRHEAYVWQREWTDAVREAVRGSRGPFSGLRVQGLAVERKAIVPLGVDAAALQGQSVIVVARIEDGASVGVGDPAVAEALLAKVRGLRAGGVTVRGVEIDHDCPTSKLTRYAADLRALRRQLGDLPLSITALPTWTTDPTGLAAVRRQADHSVLQLHAVDDARRLEHTLFDADLAVARAHRYTGGGPFWVALPAYHVALDEAGRIAAEDPTTTAGLLRELTTDPHEVARALGSLTARRPPGLNGVVWFRLPTEDDRRAWSRATLTAVIAGAPLEPSLDVKVHANADDPELFDVVAVNERPPAAPPPKAVGVLGACAWGEGVGGYRGRRRPHGWSFERTTGPLLRPGSSQPIAWVRCSELPRVEVR